MIVSVDAGIAAGKTTFLKMLMERVLAIDGKRCIYVLEPVDTWMQVTPGGEQASIFEMFYRDKTKYGFAFQMLVLQTRFQRLKQLIDDHPDAIIICERTPMSDFQVFARMMRDQDFICTHEFEVYKKWYTLALELLKPDIRGIVYLRADPVVCATRVALRNRKGEEGIDIEYLQLVHDQHEDWLMNKELPIPLCVINSNCAKDEVDVGAFVQFVSLLI
jgi:deoxyadenosine/deoxycytidine kinase